MSKKKVLEVVLLVLSVLLTVAKTINDCDKQETESEFFDDIE